MLIELTGNIYCFIFIWSMILIAIKILSVEIFNIIIKKKSLAFIEKLLFICYWEHNLKYLIPHSKLLNINGISLSERVIVTMRYIYVMKYQLKLKSNVY